MNAFHNKKKGFDLSKHSYQLIDFSNPEEIEKYGKKLEGMTFNDVLNLGIYPEGKYHNAEFTNRKIKGGLGTLIEERFFGYEANSDQKADFAEAGVELKTTCFNVLKSGKYSAGERLVITMIPYDKIIEKDFYNSHCWEKCSQILLIYYERDHELLPLEQKIHYVALFTPSKVDLEIIKSDYEKITSLIREGKAEELSEGLTNYLGACTKGSTAKKSTVPQYYPPHTPARKRAFCFKRQYMDYVLHHYIMGESERAESIVKNISEIEGKTFEQLVLDKINDHIGKSDKDLCNILEIEYTGNKAQWTKIVYALLGVRGDNAEEFEKANISVRTVRIEENNRIKESISLDAFEFKDLIQENWESSALRNYFEETRFLFVSFKRKRGELFLDGATFWSMPNKDLDGALFECWQRTKDTIIEGINFTLRETGSGTIIENNLPKMSENPVAHVRPHTHKRAYSLAGGFETGNLERDASELPDGQKMTKQSFWLNGDYVYQIVHI